MIRLNTKALWILSLVVSLGFTSQTFAQQGKPNLYMVSVGISKYKSKQFERGVQFASKDATDVANLYKAQEGKLFGKVECKLLTEEQATQENVLKALEWLKKKATTDSYVVVFLAGHGGPDALGYYSYLTHDAHPLLDSSRLAGTWVRNFLQSTKGKRFLILDTCHSGGFSGQGCDFVTMAACMAKEFSSEKAEIRNGFFTHALIEALSGKGDINKDGVVTLAELDAYVADRVQTLTNGKQQSTMNRPASMQSRLPVAMVTKTGTTTASANP